MDGVGGGERRDGRDDGGLACGDADGGFEDLDLLCVLEGCTFTEGTEHDKAGAAVAEQPGGVLSEEGVVYSKVGVKRGRHCGHYAGPDHAISLGTSCWDS